MDLISKLIIFGIPAIAICLSMITFFITIFENDIRYFMFTIIIAIISVLMMKTSMKLNPYSIHELNEYEYNYFIKNDYSPKQVHKYIELKKIKENKLKEAVKVDNEILKIIEISSDNKIEREE